MTERDRFHALMNYEPFDRPPVWFFGLWGETYARWIEEGLDPDRPVWEQLELDSDWEAGMWGAHRLLKYGPVFDGEPEVIEKGDDYKVIRHPNGAVFRERTDGSSIPLHVEEALKPTRESWARFAEALRTDRPDRFADEAAFTATAERLNARDETVWIKAGSLYGDPRNWMGVEAISLLSYDDPALYEEIIATQAEHYMTLNARVLDRVKVDAVYFFEDCCGRSGPLFSPAIFEKYYAKYYRQMVEFYKSRGVGFVLLDSDGHVEPLIECWLDAGIDILFPIEVGTWQADPVALRGRYGKRLRMMGGLDNKNLIPGPADAVRAELERLKPVVDEGGFIPLPDHRLPPHCTMDAFRRYVDIFREVFGD
jgi:uroporphyrinogen decarboxylase